MKIRIKRIPQQPDSNENAAKWHDYGGPLNYLNTGALGIMQNDKYLDAINHRSDVLAKNAGVQYSSYTPGTYAFGGELGTNGTDWTNGLLYVDAGGTHQQNPLGGVPVGFDQNGTPNLVEEGETIWNDYVFSNRIKVPKAMFHTLGLGGVIKKGITFADASKKLAKESEQRPNDPISMAGLDASLSKLAAVQEAERMKKQMREYVGLGNMAAYGGPVNRFEDGGDTDGYGEGSGGGGGAGSYFGKGYIKASINKKPYAIVINPDGVRVGYPIKNGKVDNSGKAIVINSDTPIEEGSSVNMKPAEVSEIPVSEVGNITYNAGMLPEVNSGIPERYNGPKDWGMFYSFNNPSMDVNTPELTVQGPSLYGTTERRNQPVDRAALNWVRQNYPDMDNAEDIANAISRIAKVNVTSRQFVQGANSRNGLSNNDYADAMRNILNGRGNLIAPEIGQLYTRNADRGREHFKYLQSVGIPDDIAFNIAFPEVPGYLNDMSNARHDIGLYNTMSSARNALYSELMNRNASPATQQAAITPDNTITPNEATSQYSSEEINNSTEPVSVEQEVPSYRLPETSVFNTPIDSYNLENMIMQAQNPAYAYRQPSNQTITTPRTGNYSGNSGRGVARGSSGIIPYGYYTNGNDGYSTPTGFKVGENGRAYDYTQEYRDLVGKLTANDIRAWAKEHPNDTSLQSFIARGNNLDNLTDEQWRTGALDGKYGFMHHVADSILKGDYTPASGEPQIMSAEEEEAARNNAAMQPSSNLPQPTGVNGETNPGVDLSGRTSPIDEKRPLLPTWMRYAPVFGGAAGVLGDLLGLTNKPDYTYADKLEAAANAAGYTPNISAQPIGDYIRYSPFDRLFYANQLQANARATDRALANTSAPSRAAGLLANAYNTTNSLGNLYRQGEEYNLAQRQQTADFNRRTNMFNSQMGLEAAVANARYRQAAKQYQLSGLAQAAALRDSIDQRVGAARSANLTNLFNSLGNIGRENFTFNQINQDPSRSYGYTNPWQGGIGYWPKEFDSYIDNEVQRRMEEERKKTTGAQKATQPASKACGGKIKRNKK